MTLQTGGSAFGEISTKSKDASSATPRAFSIVNTPNCSPLFPITLTVLANIS
jgi:hypothetical protein